MLYRSLGNLDMSVMVEHDNSEVDYLFNEDEEGD